MTVSSALSRKTYAGNGVTTSFATTPVVFFDATDLVVSVTDDATGAVTALTLNTHYTVAGGGTVPAVGTVDTSGGSAPYGAPAAGTTVTIFRDVAATQETDFVQNDGSDAEASEATLDRLTMIAQRLSERLDRAVALPDGDVTGASMEIPALEDRASKTLGFDADGALTIYAPASAVTDAANVTTKASGIGAVSTTVQTELRYWVRPEQFGALGDGTTDDAAAIQRAVTKLVSTGGAVWFDPSKRYKINSQIDIQSLYPIHLLSQMTGYPSSTSAGGYILPGAAISGSMFKYSSPTGTRNDAGGGVVRGLAFMDATGSSSTPGSYGMTAALELFDFNMSKVQDCDFHFINGSAIKATFCVMSDFSGNVIRYCGDTSKPALWFAATDATFCCQSTNIVDCRLEVNHDAPYLQIDDNSHSNKIRGCGFEADTLVAGSIQKFISIASDRNTVSDCHFNRNGAAVQVETTSTASFNGVVNCIFHGTANSTASVTLDGTDNEMIGCRHNSGKTGDEITVSGSRTTIIGAMFTSSGGITDGGTLTRVANSTFVNLTTTNAYWLDIGADGIACDNILDGNTTGTSGGIRLGSVTNARATGNTVKDQAGIGIRNQSAQGIVIGNACYQNTGEDFSNTQQGAIVQGNWIQDRGAAVGTPQIAKFRYPTIPVGAVAYGSLGTNTTPVSGTIYWAEVFIDAGKTLTGVGILNGATAGGTNKHIVAIYRSDGTLLANSALAGTATSGTDSFQEIAFTATTIVSPGRHWIALQMNGTTDRFRSIAASTYPDVRTTSATGSFGTLTALTPPSTFTADVGPIAYAY